MKIYKDIFDLIISPENLFLAWDSFKKGKINKPDVVKFEFHLEENIFKLHRELKNKTYKHGPYQGFWIRDPKIRHVHKATVKDRVLHHAVFRILNLIFEPTFIPTSFSCRVGKGSHKGVRKVAKMLRKVSQNNTKPCFAVKYDIKKFFDSINHAVLLQILKRKIKDKNVIWLLKEIIESFNEGGKTLFGGKGVPIGNLTSQIFANIYMNEFDQFIKHELKVKHYARYTDDFVIVSSNKAYLENLLLPIQSFIKSKLHLEIHPRKIILRKYGQGIDFLGYVILPHHIVLRTKTKRRMLWKIRHQVSLYRENSINRLTLSASFQSYMGILSHSNSYRLGQDVKNLFWFWLKE